MAAIPPSMGPDRRRAEVRRITVEARSRSAQVVKSYLLDRSIFDPERSVGRCGGTVHFPVLASLEEIRDLELIPPFREGSARIVDGPGITNERPRRKGPRTRVIEILSGTLGPGPAELAPKGWEMIGDAVVLRLEGQMKECAEEVARAFKEVLGARFVLEDVSGITGELREPSFRAIIPPADGSFEVVHRENGIDFALDPTRVMFSSGNIAHRMAAGSLLKDVPVPDRILRGRKEVVCDMFAGIGYFSLPIARGGDAVHVVAMEKNPVSYRYLLRNISANGLCSVILPVNADCRSVPCQGLADRIIMGYVGGTTAYLRAACGILSEDGGIIQLDDTVKVEEGPEALFEEASREMIGARPELEVALMGSDRVKSYAPRIEHVVLHILASAR